MTKLIITRGLPASGKTTRAQAWVAESPNSRFRVNRDHLRRMAHDDVYIPQDADQPGTERSIALARDATIAALLKRGLDVVCDDTNLPSRAARDLRRLALLAGAEFEVWDLTDVPLETCLSRNATRQGRAFVPEERIRDFWERYVRGRTWPLPIADEPDTGGDGLEPYMAPANAPRAALVDIDGTCAWMGSRSPYDETRVHEDQPNPAVIATVRALHAAGHAIVFCSGRTDGCREATEKWLREHVAVPYEALHMRATGDMRKDSIVKAELFDQHIRHAYDVVCVLDDRNQVVEMWRALGLTVLQVADGDF